MGRQRFRPLGALPLGAAPPLASHARAPLPDQPFDLISR